MLILPRLPSFVRSTVDSFLCLPVPSLLSSFVPSFLRIPSFPPPSFFRSLLASFPLCFVPSFPLSPLLVLFPPSLHHSHSFIHANPPNPAQPSDQSESSRNTASGNTSDSESSPTTATPTSLHPWLEHRRRPQRQRVYAGTGQNGSTRGRGARKDTQEGWEDGRRGVDVEGKRYATVHTNLCSVSPSHARHLCSIRTGS